MKDSRKLHEKVSMFALQMAYSPERFGPNVREARLRLRLTQEQAAQRTQVSLRTYAEWERGKALPRGYNLDNLAKALKVDPVDLLQGVSDTEPEATMFDRLTAIEANQLRIETKLDVVLELFTNAEQIADALIRRQQEAGRVSSVEGIAPRPPGTRSSAARKSPARPAKAG